VVVAVVEASGLVMELAVLEGAAALWELLEQREVMQ
jgi:hypothetical protein